MKNSNIKIVEFSLKNYAPLYESMNITEFSFDRRDSNNDIVLILGANGSGKTFIITEMSPETLEHIQGRNSNRYLPDTIGEKRIVYSVGDCEYICTITYDNIKNKTSCSFVRRDLNTGEEKELNENGNVSSYVELYEMFLGYNKTFKNVGFISSDVKNIVTMSQSERQNLFSNWIPNISQFLSSFKIAQKKYNSSLKELKSVISQLGDISLQDHKNDLINKRQLLDKNEKELVKFRDLISKINVFINSLIQYTPIKLREEVNLFKKNVSEHNSSCEKYRDMFNKYNKYLSDINGDSLLKLDISDKEGELNLLNEKIKNQIDSINLNVNKIESIKQNMTSTDKTATESIINIQSSIETIKKDMNDIKSGIETYPWNIEIFNQDIIQKVKKIYTVLLNAYQMTGKIKSYSEGFDIKTVLENNTIIDNYTGIIKDLEESNSKIEFSLNKLKYKHEELYPKILTDISDILKNNKLDTQTQLYEKIKGYLESYKVDSSEIISIDELKKNKEINIEEISDYKQKLENIKLVHITSSQVNDMLFNIREDILVLPEDILQKINSKDIYTMVNNIEFIIEDLKNFDEFLSLCDKYKESEKSIDNLKNLESLAILKEDLKQSLTLALEENSNFKNVLEELNKNKTSLEKEISSLKDIYLTLQSLSEKISGIKDEEKTLINKREELLKYNELVYNKRKLEKTLSIFKSKELDLNVTISNLKKSIEESIAFITSKEILEEKRKTLEIEQNLYKLAMNVWSSKVGYPSLVINDFLQEVLEATNKDLEYLWGGALYVKDFIINEGEFRIPIIRGTKELDDIQECSKAEKYTLALSISFAIIEVSIRNSLYNIVRLDEVDGNLDTVRRESFFDMLIRRLQNIDCKNCFAITHNPTFGEIHADVILLKGYENMIDENSLLNKNVLYKYKGA